MGLFSATQLIYNISNFVVVVIGIAYYRHYIKSLKLLIWLFIFIAFSETSIMIMSRYLNIHTNWLYYFISPVIYLFWILYISNFIANAKIKLLLKYSIPAYVLVSIIFAVFARDGLMFNFFVAAIANFIFTVFSLYILINFLKYDKGNIIEYAAFWILAGLAFYSITSMAYFAFINYIGKLLDIEFTHSQLLLLMEIHLLLNIVTNIAYMIGLTRISDDPAYKASIDEEYRYG